MLKCDLSYSWNWIIYELAFKVIASWLYSLESFHSEGTLLWTYFWLSKYNDQTLILSAEALGMFNTWFQLSVCGYLCCAILAPFWHLNILLVFGFCLFTGLFFYCKHLIRRTLKERGCVSVVCTKIFILLGWVNVSCIFRNKSKSTSELNEFNANRNSKYLIYIIFHTYF